MSIIQALRFTTIRSLRTTDLFRYPVVRRTIETKSFSARSLATMKVYTKTGDKGTSQLFSGERRPKDDDVFYALGAVDECNPLIGLAREHLDISDNDQAKIGEQLEEVMSRLFDVGSAVATPLDTSSSSKLKRASFSSENISTLEENIDKMDEELPPLKNFILPSGGKCSAHFHVARAVVRRAERRVVSLIREEKVDSSVGIYMNRLSDYLFTAARYVALKQGQNEKTYKKHSE